MAWVCANGFPKSGNHALVRACQLLGLPATVNHLPSGSEIDGPHVFIKRDPRNVVVSWLRFTGRPVTPGSFLASFRAFEQVSLVSEMGYYESWLADPKTHVVRFEDLIADEATMRGIAGFVGVPYHEGAFEHLPGPTHTYNEVHSDYRDLWTPLVAEAFSREGGDALLSRWGY